MLDTSVTLLLKEGFMISQAQGILSKSMGAISSSGSSIKALAGSHPIGLGIVVGIGAYYVVNKYWLNKDENTEAEEETEEGSEEAVSA
jgi:hypothetical protein